MAHLLLIDDDPAIIPKQLRRAFPGPAHTVEVARTGKKGLECVRAKLPDVILLDLRLPDQSGLDILTKIRRLDARIPVVFITATKSADAAIEAMRRGAYDYLFKPLDLHQLQEVIGRATDAAQQMREPAIMAQFPPDPDVEAAIIGTSPVMSDVYKAIGRVADQDDPVLITGETGTGKQFVARAVYQHSSRAGAPFLILNCAAIPENLLESELFGHEKGAFTGADRRRIGKFEQCNGGTLFLDEIGDMPFPLQAKVLRLIEDQEFERVGGNETIKTDVRLIAASNQNLKKHSAEGMFRPDLYYRLGVFTIHLPPLRDRGEDLVILIELFLRRFGAKLGREGVKLAPEALRRLHKYSWPGNVRQLQSVIKQALLLSTGNVILPEFLPDDLCKTTADGQMCEAIRGSQPGKSLAELESSAIQQCLFETEGNRQQTAEFLGISTRTLLRKIRKYELADPLKSTSEMPANSELWN